MPTQKLNTEMGLYMDELLFGQSFASSAFDILALASSAFDILVLLVRTELS